jgi:uncharacterized protein YoxC
MTDLSTILFGLFLTTIASGIAYFLKGVKQEIKEIRASVNELGREVNDLRKEMQVEIRAIDSKLNDLNVRVASMEPKVDALWNRFINEKRNDTSRI